MSLAAEHTVRVMRLYRQSLRTCLNWVIRRDLFNEEARKIRAMFERNRSKDLAEGLKLVEAGEAKLASKRHPDPYTRA